MVPFRRFLAAVPLLISFLPKPASCQDPPGTAVASVVTGYDYSNSRGFPHIFSPYKVPFVPEPRLNNERRLQDLIVDGKLILTLDAGGVGPGGAGGVLGGGIDRVSSSPCCDPSLHVSYGWSNAITPLNYTVVSGVPVDITHQTSVSAGYSQGFLTGTSLFVSESSSRLTSNTTKSIFNPELVSDLSVGVSQHLLRGFGTGSNGRFIRIARNDVKYSASVFRQDVMTAVAAVKTTYYDLLADQESIRVAQGGLEFAQKLLEDNKAETRTRPTTQYDVLRGEEEVALRQQDLLAAQNTFSQDAQSLKAKISRSFSEDLAAIEVNPTDRLPEPRDGDVPTLAEALQEATSHRPEIEQVELNLRNQQVVIQAIHNSLLPSLDVYASYYVAGLNGALSPTFTDIVRNDFPNFSYGLTLDLPIRNRTAQGDAARAQLEQRRLQMKLQNAKNQAVWDVNKAVSAVQQARGQFEATLKLAKLARQVLEMHQKTFTLASSARVEDLITAQRNLAIAEGHVVRARATYAKTLIQYEQATGTLLERNHIEMSEAIDGVRKSHQ
jgi:outer membrane protein TolC